MGPHSSWGLGAHYAAEFRILLAYFAAELRILLVYLSESLGMLGQNEGALGGGAHFSLGGGPLTLPIEPPLVCQCSIFVLFSFSLIATLLVK